MLPNGRYLLLKFGLDEQYRSLKGTVNGDLPCGNGSAIAIPNSNVN